jgi:hypothetical protein
MYGHHGNRLPATAPDQLAMILSAYSCSMPVYSLPSAG